MEIFRGTELRVSGCVQVENTDKKFRERIMNPGGARRGRGRECKPVGPSIHSPRPSLATFCRGILNRKIFRYTPGWWLVGRPCPPSPLSPPPLVHHRIISIVYRTFHPLSPTLSRKGIRVRMIAGIRIEARLVIDHSPETFTSSFEANIRRRLATILKSRCDFLPPSLQVQSSSPRRFLLPFLQDGERVFLFFFLSFLTTSSRESSNKARLIFLF